ncbi:MAG: hypothetical protein PF904_16970 [Kiritimatiellae bacterium]|jgi:hypothetical protein|nr:hypothetical protein [Kiritimatiellia bacterium]
MRQKVEISKSNIDFSMLSARESLNLKQLWVLYPGNQRYALTENITALPLCELETITNAAAPPAYALHADKATKLKDRRAERQVAAW